MALYLSFTKLWLLKMYKIEEKWYNVCGNQLHYNWNKKFYLRLSSNSIQGMTTIGLIQHMDVQYKY